MPSPLSATFGFAVGLLTTGLLCLQAQEPGTPDSPIVWTDATALALEGRGFDALTSPYDRLPAGAEGVVPKSVFGLSKHSAGLAVRFVATARSLWVRWHLRSATLAMPHMPATGVSGVDLYGRDAEGRWRWVANGRPSGQRNTVQIVSGLDGREREYLLYLPLYNGVTEVAVGVPKGATVKPPAARPVPARPLVFYGTSITQGGCASRAGMPHPAQVGRHFDREVINLGFSGSGKMETPLAELIGRIDAEVFILDCLPNMTAAMVRERAPTFIRTLRKARPRTPILLVENRDYQDGPFLAARAKVNRELRVALGAVHHQLEAEGVRGLYRLSGTRLLGDDAEGTVDGSHPTDLGFARHASAFIDALTPLLVESREGK